MSQYCLVLTKFAKKNPIIPNISNVSGYFTVFPEILRLIKRKNDPRFINIYCLKMLKNAQYILYFYISISDINGIYIFLHSEF